MDNGVPININQQQTNSHCDFNLNLTNHLPSLSDNNLSIIITMTQTITKFNYNYNTIIYNQITISNSIIVSNNRNISFSYQQQSKQLVVNLLTSNSITVPNNNSNRINSRLMFVQFSTQLNCNSHYSDKDCPSHCPTTLPYIRRSTTTCGTTISTCQFDVPSDCFR